MSGGFCLRFPGEGRASGTLPRPPSHVSPNHHHHPPPPILQEVVLWRKGDIVRKSMSHQAAIASQRFEGTAPLGEARTPGQLSDGSSRQ